MISRLASLQLRWRTQQLGGYGLPLFMLLGGFGALLVPMIWDWQRGTFASGTQGHELIIVAISAWLGFRRRDRLRRLPSPQVGWGAPLLFFAGLLLYYFGRAYDLRLALLSLVILAAALLAHFKGFGALRLVWFALLFPIFAAPLPLEWVLALTGPLKAAVSSVAAALMRAVGFEAGHSGVVITIGQYQLLVTEACAGLQTMFTLEAMGLLYANLMDYQSKTRNVLLAILVVPIAFSANVARVIILAMVTLHFGDAAGQGFLHDFAGLTLFSIALSLVIATDWLLGRIPGAR